MKRMETVLSNAWLKRTIFIIILSGLTSTAIAQLGYVFYDRIGEMKLVGRENSLYIATIDGTEHRKISIKYSPKIKDAFFSYDGLYVIYKTIHSEKMFMGVKIIEYKYFRQLVDATDERRVEIDEFVYIDYKKERIRAKNNPNRQ